MRAGDLPVMDSTSGLADPYVEVTFHTFPSEYTQIAKKTLQPVWNEDFRFEITSNVALESTPLLVKFVTISTISILYIFPTKM